MSAGHGQPLDPIEGQGEGADPGIVAGLDRLIGVDHRQPRQARVVENEAALDHAYASRMDGERQGHEPVQIEQRIAAALEHEITCKTAGRVDAADGQHAGREAMLGTEPIECCDSRCQLQGGGCGSRHRGAMADQPVARRSCPR